MPARTLPNLGLQSFFDLGEDGWKDENDLNMLKLSVLVQGGVSARVDALPAAPAAGQVVILTTNKTVQVYDAGAWVVFAPKEGWLLYDVSAKKYVSFNGADWAVLQTGGGGDLAAIREALATTNTTIGGFKHDVETYGPTDPFLHNTNLQNPTTEFAFTQNDSGETVFNGREVTFRRRQQTKMQLKADGVNVVGKLYLNDQELGTGSGGSGGPKPVVGEKAVVPYASGYSNPRAAPYDNPIQATKVGTLVLISGYVKGADGVVGTVPVGFRPERVVQGVSVGSTLANGVIEVYPTGQLYVANSAQAANYSIISIVYRVADADASTVAGGGGSSGVAPKILQSAMASANVSATAVLPSAPAAGQIILAVCSGFSATKNFPAGFVRLPSSALTNNTVEAAFKIADGTEGTNITVTANADRCNLSVFVLDRMSEIRHTNTGQQGANWQVGAFAIGGACLSIVAIETDPVATFTYDASNKAADVSHFFQNNGGNHNGLTFAVTQTKYETFKGTMSSAQNAPSALYQVI